MRLSGSKLSLPANASFAVHDDGTAHVDLPQGSYGVSVAKSGPSLSDTVSVASLILAIIGLLNSLAKRKR